MKPKTLNIFAWVAIVVIAISLVNLGLQLTGFAIDDMAIVNISVASSAAINFTTDLLDFGSGGVNMGKSVAVINSEGSVTDGNWTAVNGQLVLENIGNQNVSLAIQSDKDAAAYLGGTSPSFKFKTVESTKPGSCVGGDAITYTEISTSPDTVCTTFPFDDSMDIIEIEIELTIPSDSLTGDQQAVITATGTAI